MRRAILLRSPEQLTECHPELSPEESGSFSLSVEGFPISSACSGCIPHAQTNKLQSIVQNAECRVPFEMEYL